MQIMYTNEEEILTIMVDVAPDASSSVLAKAALAFLKARIHNYTKVSSSNKKTEAILVGLGQLY